MVPLGGPRYRRPARGGGGGRAACHRDLDGGFAMVGDPRPRLTAFTSRLHSPAVAGWLGIALGVAFTLAFLTGLASHLFQHQPSWLALPTRPPWFYRVSQGVHVVAGIASVPLLLAKLWTVYPKLFAWPPFRS